MNRHIVAVGLWVDRHKVWINRVYSILCMTVGVFFGLTGEPDDFVMVLARLMACNIAVSIPWFLLMNIRHRAIYGRWLYII